MSRLTAFEKRKWESLLGMGSGYVLDFTNRTFQQFVLDLAGKDIFAEKYSRASGSKANRLRAFWESEPDHVVAKLLEGLLKYGADRFDDPRHVQDCQQIVERLRLSAPVEDLDALEPADGDRAFEALARSVRQAIDNNEPEVGLDRLHTFVIKYLRMVCARHNIDVAREKPLHSLLGEYVKWAKSEGLMQSVMSERILKSSISILEAFNTVRNEQSLAHDNPLLSYHEALFIFNSISSTIRFVTVLDEEAARRPQAAALPDDDLPF